MFDSNTVMIKMWLVFYCEFIHGETKLP
jgi:hypothetical protein